MPHDAVHNEVFSVDETKQNYRVREIAEIAGKVFLGSRSPSVRRILTPGKCFPILLIEVQRIWRQLKRSAGSVRFARYESAESREMMQSSYPL